MHYNKPPLSFQQQIQLLKSRNLQVNNFASAIHCLSNISYYRLSAYMLPFQTIKDTFNTGTEFQQIVELYTFDRQIRLLVFDAIERIEIAVRTQMIYQLSHKYGSHWQDNPALFRYANVYSEIQNFLNSCLNSANKEVFIEHYTNMYSSPINPPSWMSIELLTIGQLSLLYKAIKSNTDRKDISDYFSLHHTVFQSWLHTITYVRNICAHHARLWNRDFAIQPDILLRPRLPWINLNYNNNRRCYYFLCSLKYLLQTVNPNERFEDRLKDLIHKHPNIPIQFIGFPKNWLIEPLWK